jgi:hypothetical protein
MSPDKRRLSFIRFEQPKILVENGDVEGTGFCRDFVAPVLQVYWVHTLMVSSRT